LRLALLIGVLHDNAKAHFAIFVAHCAKNPYSRSVHLHDHVCTFSRSQEQRVDRALSRHRVAVKRDDSEAVAGKRKRDVLCRTGVEQPEQHALAFADANGLTMAQHLVVERGPFVEDFKAVVGWRTLSEILHADPRAVPMMCCE
jgi:hypothetical protein